MLDLLYLVKFILGVEHLVRVLLILVLSGVVFLSVALERRIVVLRSAWVLLDDVLVGASWHVRVRHRDVLFVLDVVLASLDIHLSDLHSLLLFHLLAIKVLVLSIFQHVIFIWFVLFLAFSHGWCGTSHIVTALVILLIATLFAIFVVLALNHYLVRVDAIV